MAERLKADFREGQPLAGLSAKWLNTIATFYNKLDLLYGSVIRAPDGKVTLAPYQPAPGGSGGSLNAAWSSGKSGDLEVTLIEGDIELGPDTVIAWGSITNATTTVTPSTGQSAWVVWVEIDMANETAEMFSAASVDALSSEEQKTILQKRICEVAISADVITSVKACQVGNIFIPRL